MVIQSTQSIGQGPSVGPQEESPQTAPHAQSGGQSSVPAADQADPEKYFLEIKELRLTTQEVAKTVSGIGLIFLGVSVLCPPFALPSSCAIVAGFVGDYFSANEEALKKQVRHLAQTNTRLEDNVMKLDEQRELLAGNIESLEQELGDFKNGNEALKKQVELIRSLREQISALNQEYANNNTQLSQVRKQLETEVDRLKELENDKRGQSCHDVPR